MIGDLTRPIKPLLAYLTKLTAWTFWEVPLFLFNIYNLLIDNIIKYIHFKFY